MNASPACGGVFDLAVKEKRTEEIESLSASPDFWNNAQAAQALMREMAALKQTIDANASLLGHAEDADVMIQLAEEAHDDGAAKDAEAEVLALPAQHLRQLRVSAIEDGHAPPGGEKKQDITGQLL